MLFFSGKLFDLLCIGVALGPNLLLSSNPSDPISKMGYSIVEPEK
uniref:Uncharacterized protein n=1 Tax=Rhizophora mucronata TaxID=61149 RepID=A0A2P2NFJ2_RHIMU